MTQAALSLFSISTSVSLVIDANFFTSRELPLFAQPIAAVLPRFAHIRERLLEQPE